MNEDDWTCGWSDDITCFPSLKQDQINCFVSMSDAMKNEFAMMSEIS